MQQPGRPHQAYYMPEGPRHASFEKLKCACGGQGNLAKLVTCSKIPGAPFLHSSRAEYMPTSVSVRVIMTMAMTMTEAK